jgi:toxin ParE1/3/4
MIYEFHPAAEAEFLESVGFYESQVRGLGAAFMQNLNSPSS